MFPISACKCTFHLSLINFLPQCFLNASLINFPFFFLQKFIECEKFIYFFLFLFFIVICSIKEKGRKSRKIAIHKHSSFKILCGRKMRSYIFFFSIWETELGFLMCFLLNKVYVLRHDFVKIQLGSVHRVSSGHCMVDRAKSFYMVNSWVSGVICAYHSSLEWNFLTIVPKHQQNS